MVSLVKSVKICVKFANSIEENNILGKQTKNVVVKPMYKSGL